MIKLQRIGEGDPLDFDRLAPHFPGVVVLSA